MTGGWHHHGSDTPTSPRAILHHTDAILCIILHTTVCGENLKKHVFFYQLAKLHEF